MELKPNVPGDLPDTQCQENTQQVVGVPLASTNVLWELSPMPNTPDSLVLTNSIPTRESAIQGA